MTPITDSPIKEAMRQANEQEARQREYEYKIPEIAKILDTHEAQTADYTEEERNAMSGILYSA